MQTLKTAAICSTILGIIILPMVGYFTLLNGSNAKIEAKCIAQGGQVIVTPGEVSRCLLPAAR